MVPPTATADSECLCVLFAAAVAAAAAAAAAAVEAEAAAADDRKFTPGNAEVPPECIADEAAAATPVAPVTFNDDTPLGDRNCHALRMLSWPTLSDNAGVGFRPGRAYPTFWAYDRLWRGLAANWSRRELCSNPSGPTRKVRGSIEGSAMVDTRKAAPLHKIHFQNLHINCRKQAPGGPASQLVGGGGTGGGD